MKMTKALVGGVLLAALATLPACNRSGQGNDAQAGNSQGEAKGGEAARGGEVELRPGQWESTVEVVNFSVPGLPEEQQRQMREMMAAQSEAQSECVTPERAANMRRNLLRNQPEGANCNSEGVRMEGGRISGTMRCTGENGGDATAEFSGEYGPEQMTMQVVTRANDPMMGGRVEMTVRNTSRRVGECTTPPPAEQPPIGGAEGNGS